MAGVLIFSEKGLFRETFNFESNGIFERESTLSNFKEHDLRNVILSEGLLVLFQKFSAFDLFLTVYPRRIWKIWLNVGAD